MPQSPKHNDPTSDVWANRIILTARAAETQLWRLEHSFERMQYADVRPAINQLWLQLKTIKEIAEQPPLPFG